jgi:hypothetical protein
LALSPAARSAAPAGCYPPSCPTAADTEDLAALIAAGCGDVPLVQLRYRCAHCRSGRTDFVVVSKDSAAVMPW